MEAETLIVLGLARAGYGTIAEILELPAGWVMDAYEHMVFAAEYQETEHEINRPA